MTEDFQELTNIAQYLDSLTLKTPDKIFLVTRKVEEHTFLSGV
jgi:hypothetical protein